MSDSALSKDYTASGTEQCVGPTDENLANPEEGLNALKTLLQCRQSD
jgi:hypothetical protein